MGGKLNMTVYLLWILTILTVFDNMAVSGTSTTGIVSTDAPETTAPVSLTTSADLSPTAPAVVFVDPLVPLMLYVSWLMPDGRNASSYNISLNGTVSFTTNETYHLIESSLLYGAFYDVGVQACENDQCSNITTNSSATYPAAPENLKTIDFGENHLRLQWFQQGGYESINVMVNYDNCSNVTDQISISPVSASSNDSNTVSCNITNLPTAGGHYEIVIDIKFMDLKNISQNDSYTRPAMPGEISPGNQTTSEICVKWNQSGNVFDFNVTVNGTIPSNISTELVPSSSAENENAENENCSDCYNCSWFVDMCISGFSNLTVAGEMYEINVTAFANNLYSTPQTSFQATAPYAPSEIDCSNQYNSSLTILIVQPADGKYDNFVITYRSQISGFPDDGVMITTANEEVINNLTAGLMYLFEVKAQSFSVFGESEKNNCTTVPNAPKEFKSSTLSASSIQLDWVKPDGYPHEYGIMYTSCSSAAQKYINGSSTSFLLTSLLSDCQYNTTIFTRNFGFSFSSSNETSSNYTFPAAVGNLDFANVEQTEVVVSWNPPERHDNVGLYELIVLNRTGSCLRTYNLTCYDKHLPLHTGFTKNCPVNNYSIECNKSVIDYHVTGLSHSTEYNISVAAWNPGGKAIAIGKWLTTAIPPNNDWIIGVVIGVIFGVLLVLLAFLLFHRWRNDKSPFEKRSESSPSVGGRENPNYEEEPEPISINDFAGHVSKMNQDSNYLFACEYLLLGKLSAKKSTTAAELPDNRTKNRYTDVLPFDDSRVTLVPYNDMGEGDSSDYINASYLPGFNSRREYIAAQGPMRSTVDDFWLMIWQQRVATIIMVTNLVERGREKCEQYWPSDNEPICYGDISVGLKSESTFDFYTLRVMEMSFNSEKRSLTQYHFLTWPDFGVPDKVEDILDFVTEVRGHFRGTAPMLVHCSAGVGRTGTFIVVDHLLQLIRREMYVDLFHLVLDLRQHRPKMIQAESQYIFAHECIKMAISRGYHKRNSMYMAESDPAGENGNCLYVNASDIVIDEPPLYANAGEIREHPV